MNYRKGRTQDIMDGDAGVIILIHKSLPTKLVKIIFIKLDQYQSTRIEQDYFKNSCKTK